VQRHPNYHEANVHDNDLAIVRLKSDVQGITPAKVNASPLTVRQELILVGYGWIEDNTYHAPEKRTGINHIANVMATTFDFWGNSNVCNGDSGGPSFISRDGVESIAGIHSTKTGECGYGGTDMRVDSYVSWISTVATEEIGLSRSQASEEPAEPPPPPATEPEAEGPAPRALEGQSCEKDQCKDGLACITVYTVYSTAYSTPVGKFCMESCTWRGWKSSCEQGEYCAKSRTGRRVCFNPTNPEGGFTTP
jgi:hypothetical protein